MFDRVLDKRHDLMMTEKTSMGTKDEHPWGEGYRHTRWSHYSANPEVDHHHYFEDPKLRIHILSALEGSP